MNGDIRNIVDQLNNIEKNKFVFLCLDKDEYKNVKIKNWIKENCKIIYSIDNNDFYPVSIIKCEKITNQNFK